MEPEGGMLLFFDEEPSKDNMAHTMKILKKQYKKLQSVKRVRDDSESQAESSSGHSEPKRKKTDNSSEPKRWKIKRKNEQLTATSEPCTDCSGVAPAEKLSHTPTDACALPTMPISLKARKLDSRLNRLMKSKERSLANKKAVKSGDGHFVKSTKKKGKKRKCTEDDKLSDECSTVSVDSGIQPDTKLSPKAKCSVAPGNSSIDSDGQSDAVFGEDCSNVETGCDTSSRVTIDESLYVAMDCEFVGTGPKGSISALGRCSVVDYHGNTLCDIYVQPEAQITDYRTPWSGIRPRHMQHAIPVESARRMVKKVLKDKIVLGHMVWNDFKVLKIHHPKHMIRDTGTYTPLHQMAATEGNAKPPRSLKKLSTALLGRVIQKGPHSSLEDATATLDLFKLVAQRWEAELREKSQNEDVLSKRARPRTFSETSLDNVLLNDDYWPANL